MKSIILDTNAYSSFIKNDLQVTNEIKNCDIVFLPSIVIGELYSGFYQGNKFQFNEGLLELFLNNVFSKTVSVHETTSKIYGKIYSELLKNGTPIPTNDIWIAAIAIEKNSVLVTYDNHFLKIPNLKLWSGIK